MIAARVRDGCAAGGGRAEAGVKRHAQTRGQVTPWTTHLIQEWRASRIKRCRPRDAMAVGRPRSRNIPQGGVCTVSRNVKICQSASSLNTVFQTGMPLSSFPLVTVSQNTRAASPP
jgi:hypothetical protein